MTTLYRKTGKGQAEIETRAHRLQPRLRMALILVDGRRSEAELVPLIAVEPGQTLSALLDQGFIEAVEAAPVRPSAAAPRPEGSPKPARAAAPAGGFEQRRRDAVRQLIDQVGPMGEAIALRMEKSRDMGELLPALQLGQQVLRNTRGAAAAADYARRFIDTSLG